MGLVLVYDGDFPLLATQYVTQFIGYHCAGRSGTKD